ncbi:MAG: hypothetical protein JWQ74_3566 [Marmoricola sp.]|nr:hypothetical protein [Marmoricola sp.]
MAYEYKIKDGFIVLATITGEDRRETVNRAVKEAHRLHQRGFKTEVHGIGPEDWALVEPFKGWDKTVVQ